MRHSESAHKVLRFVWAMAAFVCLYVVAYFGLVKRAQGTMSSSHQVFNYPDYRGVPITWNYIQQFFKPMHYLDRKVFRKNYWSAPIVPVSLSSQPDLNSSTSQNHNLSPSNYIDPDTGLPLPGFSWEPDIIHTPTGRVFIDPNTGLQITNGSVITGREEQHSTNRWTQQRPLAR